MVLWVLYHYNSIMALWVLYHYNSIMVLWVLYHYNSMPLEIGRQPYGFTHVCTVRFGTKELSNMWHVVPGC